MPEFILDHGDKESAARFNALDYFTQGYIEAMFFTEASAPEDECFGATVADLSPEAWEKIKADCKAFQEANAATLEAVFRFVHDADTRAGRDYWFTRNGHGVGFWEPGRWPKPYGDLLDKATDRSEVYLYRGDDGRLYIG